MIIDAQNKYTYADYLTWDDGKRYEIIEGKVYFLPTGNPTIHQAVVGNLMVLLGNYFEQNRHFHIELFTYFDIRILNKIPKIDYQFVNTVVQPDISIIPNTQIEEISGFGCPIFIAEVISEESKERDEKIKFALYEKAKLPEFWLVYPELKQVKVFYLEGDKFSLKKEYSKNEQISLKSFPEIHLNVNDIFDEVEELEKLFESRKK
jgi:Uma2 family endonuclease